MMPSNCGQQCQFSLECVALPVISTLVTVAVAWWVLSRINFNRGIKYACFSVLQQIPLVSSYLSKVRTRVVSELRHSQKKNISPILELPEKGKSYDAITKACDEMQLQDSKCTSRMSGALYISPNSEVYKLCAQVYTQFAHTNPLHIDAFPSVCRMEAEVVSFVSSLHGSKIVDGICGNMTSGGTESILSAIRTSRDYMRAVHGVKYPEMVASVSAHAAIHKAAEYFNIKLILIGTDRHGRLSLSELKQKMNRNVILVYASAPGYPHGIIDPVEDIAKCVSSWGCCLHVDACLGGFLLPFINDSQVHGTKKIKYGFEIPAVTSMSVDTHKYGCAHKGSSVVLYRSRSIRKFQYTAVTSWTGGMYISPSQPGSRSGGLVAQTWAALNYFGHDGYAKMAQSIVEASLLLRKRILNIPQLELIGEDVTMIVAWKSKDKGIDIYVINDLLTDMGWHLSVLHSPPALHFCITSANVDSIDLLIDDLLKAMKCAKSGKHNSKNSRAPIYGMANKMSNTSIVDDLLKDVQDSIDQS